MTTLPALTGKDLVRVLERVGFDVRRVKGSHTRNRWAASIALKADQLLPFGIFGILASWPYGDRDEAVDAVRRNGRDGRRRLEPEYRRSHV